MKLAMVPELQNVLNKQVNRGLRLVNIVLFLLITASIIVALTTYRNIEQVQNVTLSGPDGGAIGVATLVVPNWVIIPAKVEHDARLRLSRGGEVPASLVRSASVREIDITLLRAEGAAPELFFNAASLGDGQEVYVQDNGAEWTGNVRKEADGLYSLSGDRQFPAGLPVTANSDHTALVGMIASGRNGPVVVSIEQLQQIFPELK